MNHDDSELIAHCSNVQWPSHGLYYIKHEEAGSWLHQVSMSGSDTFLVDYRTSGTNTIHLPSSEHRGVNDHLALEWFDTRFQVRWPLSNWNVLRREM